MKIVELAPEELVFPEEDMVIHAKYQEGCLVCGEFAGSTKSFIYQFPLTNFSKFPFSQLCNDLNNHNPHFLQASLKIIAPQSQENFFLHQWTHLGFKKLRFISAESVGSQIYYYAKEKRLRVAKNKIKVLIIDDSLTIHQLFTRILQRSADIEVVGVVQNPLQTEEMILRHEPDVLTVDIQMDKMDGVTLLRHILPQYPIPSLLVSSLSRNEGTQVLDGLQAGAVDYMQKPSLQNLEVFSEEIIEKVRMASQVEVKIFASPRPQQTFHHEMDTESLIAIGASTGGTEALVRVLSQLPESIPPILIVQHIPAVFSKAFAERLNKMYPFDVCEAQDGQAVIAGKVYIAPGGRHMSLQKKPNGLIISIHDQPPVNRHRPSVDVLFDSVAQVCNPRKTVGVILTGMGSDGAQGLLHLKHTGAVTVAQDQATSIVYGMPKVAKERGAVDHELPLDQIADFLQSHLSKIAKAS